MQENETVDFQLSKELSYSKGGNKEVTACITMRPPTMAEYNQSTAFSQIVTQAFMDAQKWADNKKEKAVKKDDKDMDAGAVRIMLFASDRNIVEVSKRFKELAARVCTMDGGETYMKDANMGKMEMEDFIKMMCEYVANFIYPSLFNAMEDEEGKESPKQSGEPSEAT